MSGAAKTILIIGGVAVGAFLLAKALGSKTTYTRTAGQSPSSTANVITALSGVVSPIVSYFATRPSSSSSDAVADYHAGDSAEDYTTQLFGPGNAFENGVVS